MKKKRSTRLTVNLLDIFIGIVCLAGTIYCLALFWKDINVSFSKANEEPIAVIYFKKNTAQRKLIDGNIWERLKTATPIYNGDKIRTAALSEAYTIFNDCSKIDLHENTLIQVFNRKDKNSIDFVSGSISVLSTENPAAKSDDKEDKSFQINTGSKVISFDSSTSAVISISSKNANQATITVTSGEVIMEDIIPTVDSAATKILSNIGIESAYKAPATANVTTITAGSSIEFEPLTLNQQLKDILSDFAVTMPTSTYSVTLSKTKQTYVPFFWSNTKELQIDFARDSGFQDILTTKTLSSASGRSSVSIDFAKNEQTVYWRAIPLPLSIETRSEREKEFPHGVIFINQPEEMVMLQPIATVFGEDAAAEMDKEIQANQEKSDIQLLEIINGKIEEPETEPEVVEPITEEPVKEAVVEKPAEKPAEKPTAKTAEKPAPKPDAPQKSATSDIVNVSPSIDLVNKGQVLTEEFFMTDNPAIPFTWRNVKGAEFYILEIFDANKTKILSKKVKSSVYNLQDNELALLNNGTYTWTLTANQTVDGKEYSSKTASGTFTIKIEDIESAEVDTENLLQ